MKALAFAAAALMVGCATNTPPARSTALSERSGVVTDAKGMALYTFKKDTANTSNCYDACAKAWPPFAVGDPAKATSELTVIQRKDGSQQWAFNGQPLYRFAGDTEPGQFNGEGKGGVWYVIHSVQPSAAASGGGGGGY